MTHMRFGIAGALTLLTGAGAAMADAPKVVVDIAPLHGLVARVMYGVGTPGMVLRQGASPHGYAMRPSEAAMLQEADVVFYIGADLTPWMEEALETLADDAQVFEMMALDGTTQLPFRDYTEVSVADDGQDHEAHGHDDHEEHAHKDDGHGEHDHEDHAEKEYKHDEHGHDGHAHEDHAADSHKHDEEGHDDHASHDRDHDHAHGDVDPHGWLDPQNAAFWMNIVAEALGKADPDNAALYSQNATRGIKEIKAAAARVDERLFPYRTERYVVFHDAYQYFEKAFDLETAAALALGDATAPGARRVAAIRDLIQDEGISCIFTEPQFSAKLIDTVSDGTDVATSVIDPLGAEIAPGPQFYPTLLTTIADSMAGCFNRS